MGRRDKRFDMLDLSPQRLRVCLLRIKGKTHAEIAKRLGVSRVRVTQQLLLALARYPELTDLLKPRGRHRMYQLNPNLQTADAA